MLIINLIHGLQPLYSVECPRIVSFRLTFVFSPYGLKLNTLNQKFKPFGLRPYLGKFKRITRATSLKKISA